MSDYQHVKVMDVQGTTLTLHITERHPDMQTLHDMRERGANPGGEPCKDQRAWRECLNAAALLLWGDHEKAGRVWELLSDEEVDEGFLMDAQNFISSVALLDMKPLGESSQPGIPLHEAILQVELTRPELAALFARGDDFYSVAYVYGDLDDAFG